jgi:hydroxymethylpyrimidine pyrophosphatase-like HAD family hydrolase
MRCLYLDLDGTLLGRGASLLHDGEGEVTIDGVRAVQACLRAGVEVVLMSGRRRAQVFEDARLRASCWRARSTGSPANSCRAR